MRQRGTKDIATGRQLQLSLAETYLQRNMFVDAESLLLDLKHVTSTSGGPDYSIHTNEFRIWVCLARIAHKQGHWNDALSRWTNALKAAERIELGGGFNAGIVRYSMAHVLQMIGNKTESGALLHQAKENIASESWMFWIPAFNSKWYDFIVRESTWNP